MTVDWCGCCQVCARSEGQLCDAGDGSKELGLCGENLECAKRDDVPGVSMTPLQLTKPFELTWRFGAYLIFAGRVDLQVPGAEDGVQQRQDHLPNHMVS